MHKRRLSACTEGPGCKAGDECDKRSPRFFFVMVFIFSFMFRPLPACAAEQLIDRVVAVVNDEAITQSELDVLFIPVHAQLVRAYQGSELTQKLEEAHRAMLNQLIEDRLVLQASQKAGIDVTDQEAEERFAEFKKQFRSEEEFDQLLRSQNVEIKTLKKRIRDQIAIQKMYYVEVQRTVVVSPADVEQFYARNTEMFIEREKVKAWSITIPKDEKAVQRGTIDEAAKRTAFAILKDVKKGKDFSELAKRESRDSRAKEGGLIGYVSRGDMIPQIDEALFRLPDNQVSDLLETETAYHIFKVGDHQPARKLEFEEVRERIFELLYRQKSEARFQIWMGELKKSAFISIR